MIKTRSRKNKPDKESFYAVCRDCGSIKDESFDHRRCECGGVFHVDSAYQRSDFYDFYHDNRSCYHTISFVDRILSPAQTVRQALSHFLSKPEADFKIQPDDLDGFLSKIVREKKQHLLVLNNS